ncbi:MAG: endonuclease/exonuclease/phosphatase family protein [Armatimonadota bacterium]|nr:endonuclease/exonuclease/phosphatase family protein [Armatimonadota bacterium]MDR7403492.1 endonuclease/exonuclease/phosphatase family protein [Armatimonadota bacterium]MDR7516305.1 endonuclease/exonuclease/phosphatase family protein [Armatimonadota bacterium]MDR7559985.1 endonuclease/exonuclease/phosphatase family protein [Armatimonadota bacterium]MDR7587658.1 endonuclease/exonuclease/phosphatase family protein [Armatimonadota bacterium]
MRSALRWVDLFAAALTAWTGIHALRAFLSMIVWNIGQDRAPTQLGAIALGFWTVGLMAWPVARRLGGRRPEVRFALIFGMLYALNQSVAHPSLTPALSVAAWVAWLWLFPSVVAALGGRGTASAVLPGLLLGVAAQVAVQAALQGLDLPVLRGPTAGAVALLLAAALYGSVLPLTPASGRENLPGWGLAALGPYLVLQLTLLANPGWVAVLAGWDMLRTATLILLGLVAACVAAAWDAPASIRAVAAVAAVAALLRPGWLAGPGVWLVPAVQMLLVISLAGALASRPTGSGPSARRASHGTASVYGWTAVAAVLIFALLFSFYSHYTWPQLWAVMAALAVVPTFLRTRGAAVGALRAAAAGGVVGTLGLIVCAAGIAQARAAGDLAARDRPAPPILSVATYNIHQAFTYRGVPDPEGIARVIESLDADLVGLQEVGRGWNVNGGPDLVAWLRWRLPQYRVVYAPMLGDLVGHVILSRYPISDYGWRAYPRRTSPLAYGLTWVVVPTAAGDLLFVTTHFSPYAAYAADREAQAADLLTFWQGRPRAVIAGDFNATPSEATIRRLLDAGLRELTVPHGLGEAFTFASGRPYERIDYLFASSDVTSVSASIPQTTASDHLPVVAQVRLR